MAEEQTENVAESPDAESEGLNLEATVTEPKPQRKPLKEPDKGGFYWGTGRRKSAVARVRIKPGEGKLLINKKELTDYFDREQDRNQTTVTGGWAADGPDDLALDRTAALTGEQVGGRTGVDSGQSDALDLGNRGRLRGLCRDDDGCGSQPHHERQRRETPAGPRCESPQPPVSRQSPRRPRRQWPWTR